MAKNTIYFLSGYNNYYNRTLKVESVRRADYYVAHSKASIYEAGVNFNPNDNIRTMLVCNYKTLEDATELDYLIVCDSSDEPGEEGVLSCWFIMERTRNLTGQWSLQLKRDVLADLGVMDSPAYIERGCLRRSNPLIFNSEGLQYNQIKKGETLLKDPTGSGWYVGYVVGDLATQNGNQDDPITITVPAEQSEVYPSPPIDYATLQTLSAKTLILQPTYTVTARGEIHDVNTRYRVIEAKTNGISNGGSNPSYNPVNPTPYPTRYEFNTFHTANEDAELFAAALLDDRSNIESKLNLQIPNTYDVTWDSTYQLLTSMDGQLYYDGTHYFYINFVRQTTSGHGAKVVQNSSAAVDLYNICKNACNMYEGWDTNKELVQLWWSASFTQGNIIIHDVTSQYECTATIHYTANKLSDAPYKMFAIPAEPIKVSFSGTPGIVYENTRISSKSFANEIARALGGAGSNAKIYDLQYLPYCPIKAKYENGKLILAGTWVDNIDKSITVLSNSDDTQHPSYMLWATNSNFTIEIAEEIVVPNDNIDFKIMHETQFCRLCAPNYSGAFEFKATSNNGVSVFEANCTYMPYQPYIHINPKFNNDGLYGGDYNDQRGLVITGSLSIPVVTDRWVEYQINNASYKDAFDRRVENMETIFDLEYRRQKIAGALQIATAGIAGATGGAVTGGKIGGATGAVAGAAIGAVAGTAASGIGMAYDLKFSQDQFRENLDFTKDMFEYNLQNIKALPNSIAKIGAFNINNKVFPFVEYYDCTDEEKEVLRKKIQYDGMNAGCIDTIENFVSQNKGNITLFYIKARLIRYEGEEPLDATEAMEINNELLKGVYIQWV